MFQTIKEKLSIIQVLEDLTETKVHGVGENTFAMGENDADICVFCGHKGCARVKYEEDDQENSFYHCFSCDTHVDVIGLTAKLKDITDGESAKLLAKQYNIQLPRDWSPVQDVMNLAAQYYHTCFKEAGKIAELSGKTPIQYQTEQRGHNEESYKDFQIGWSDGHLIEYLESVGISAEIIKETGLVNKKGGDFLPARSFIYPHKIRGRVSHFTFKDPLKRLEYQLPNKHKLNGHSFYNSDSLTKEGPVIIVEGENDLLSVAEAGWKSGNIACIGQLSGSQLEWIETNLSGKEVITIFDSDGAGDKYREKVAKLKRCFAKLTQVKVGNGQKDVDEYLKAGGDLGGLIRDGAIGSSTGSSDPEVAVDGDSDSSENGGILEKGGGYYKIRYKEGNEFLIKLSNFTIKLRNIFIRGQEREREIVIVREDGKESKPLMITSDAKVSLKPFRTMVANAIDASFYGKEDDMTAIWEYVYRTSKEVVVHLPEYVGRVAEFKGWLFGDMFITDLGAVYLPDENGVIWISNRSVGLRAMSMETGTVSHGEMSGVPKMSTELKEEDRVELIGGVLNALSANLGDAGSAINIMAWAWASVHSDVIFAAIKHFPFLYLWGRHGRGKTTINKWLLSFFDLETSGWSQAPQLNSGVSFSRKLSYYSSLPMCIDEIKAERSIIEMYGTFRSWFNRGGRSVSSREGFGIRTQEVRSTIMFSGEDQFVDPATRQRCIHVRIPQQGREEVHSYKWMDNHARDLPAIGYHWILNAHKEEKSAMLGEIKELDTLLRNNGISSRTSLNWAIIAHFGKKLCKEYMPDFDYMAYLITATQEDVSKQAEDDTLNQFWDVVEGIHSEERPRISGSHLRYDDGKLHVWFAEIYRIVDKDNTKDRNAFSKRAIYDGLKEEGYFIGDGRVKLGIEEVYRRVITLDVEKAPDVVKRIAGAIAG